MVYSLPKESVALTEENLNTMSKSVGSRIDKAENRLQSQINELSKYDSELERRINEALKKIEDTNGNFVYLSANLKVPVNANTAGTTISYPSGFDKDNCKVISLMGYDQAQAGWFTSVGISTYRTYNLNVFLGTQGITIRVQKVSNISSAYEIPISIGLAKINN